MELAGLAGPGSRRKIAGLDRAGRPTIDGMFRYAVFIRPALADGMKAAAPVRAEARAAGGWLAAWTPAGQRR
jgi:hypothetical protein